ncbi:hypothetical protein D3C81_2083440 [compost metagenome]
MYRRDFGHGGLWRVSLLGGNQAAQRHNPREGGNTEGDPEFLAGGEALGGGFAGIRKVIAGTGFVP